MITVKERGGQQRVFDSIRHTVQGIHPRAEFADDGCGSPFLLKSTDAKVWGRVFYRPMSEIPIDELKRELIRLKRLMPGDAYLYLFFPSLDRDLIRAFHSSDERLVFFEYGGASSDRTENPGIKIQKWVPASMSLRKRVAIKEPLAVKGEPVLFLDRSRLSSEEIAELTELGLRLRRT